MEAYNKYGEKITNEEEVINGYSQSEIMSFVGSNGDRYSEIFKKNQNKKLFFNMNWAAMLLSAYWMFYRKMYVEGIIFIIISRIVSILLLTSALFIMKDEALILKNQYNDNSIIQKEIIIENIDDFSQIKVENNGLNQQLKSLQGKILFIAIIPQIILSFFFGLIANCIYRNYVLRKIKFSDGGTSKIAILGAFALVFISNSIGQIFNKALIHIIWM